MRQRDLGKHQFVRIVGVTVEGNQTPCLMRLPNQAVGEVLARWIAVHFDGHIIRGRRGEDGRPVRADPITFAELPSARIRQDVDAGR